MELRFRNFELQNERDWFLLIDSGHGFIQFLAVPDAVDLFISGLEATHSEAEDQKLVLPSFTLDTTTLSQPDLARVQRIVSHCILERLVVKCDLIDLSMSDPVAKVLESVQWPVLESLRLSGDNINHWIQLLSKINTPRLKTLQICGTKLVQQELSHASILSVERLIGTSSLMQLHFRYIRLQDQHDWVRLLDKMDPSMLDGFGLGEGSHQQFKATRFAANLKFLKKMQWRPKKRGVIE
ncbi:hypothetical protein BG005_000853 [Podila minutissima]|nr:hypothetical protein BG005_000853 [Podila minutissima]